MQVIKINGTPVTSGQYEIMLDDGESVNDLDISNLSIGSVAYKADRSEVYVLDPGYIWRQVVASSSSSSSPGGIIAPTALTNSEIEAMLL